MRIASSGLVERDAFQFHLATAATTGANEAVVLTAEKVGQNAWFLWRRSKFFVIGHTKDNSVRVIGMLRSVEALCLVSAEKLWFKSCNLTS